MYQSRRLEVAPTPDKIILLFFDVFPYKRLQADDRKMKTRVTYLIVYPKHPE